ncbi:hypothetical protein [Bradyrhizobium sp. CW1]|uniref:hypothetical protein n=1 Tax=Bradyrhizobium sp. CW1 TaxID=2782686 RepID=UPI001FFF3A5D|nr:hypothetical protein [Bradyrhizobium sp. CW1]UPJ31014.1 hypothetical protein IVB54_19415 [Bradyrhizobium sp. CW1]
MALSTRPPPLTEERINAFRGEIDAFIDARAAKIKETCEGVPVGVIRNLLTARSGGCQCAAYLELMSKDAAEAEAQKGAA